MIWFLDTKDELTERYGIIKCGAAQFDALDKSDIISYRKMDYEWQILVSDRERMQKKYGYQRCQHSQYGKQDIKQKLLTNDLVP